MNRKIEVFDYAKEIVSAIPKGVLLTTKNGEAVNTMTIGWGTLGVEWGVPIFIAFVREGRFTRELPLTLECKVLYRQLQDKNAILESIRQSMYPEDADSSCPGANRDYHIAYYGQIVNAYIVE